MNLELTIRPPASHELIETVQIYLDCLREDYRFLPQSFLDSRAIHEELGECQDWVNSQDHPNKIFAAFIGNAMVGYIAVGPNTGEPRQYDGEVTNLFLRRAYRKRGIGLRLLQTGLAYLGSLGYENVIIYSFRASESNGFYRKMGGEEVSTMIQSVGGGDFQADVFAWKIDHFQSIVLRHLHENVNKEYHGG